MSLAALQPAAFGPYLVEKQIGSGAMGVVFKARHQATLELVAVKSVRLRSPELLASFRREIHALAMLRHPGIVRIIQHGLIGDTPWYAMKLVEGEPLSRRLAALRDDTLRGPEEESQTRTKGPSPFARTRTSVLEATSAHGRTFSQLMPLKECLDFGRSICRTLGFLHSNGLVHRDLKPGNVILQADGAPVLVDFGLVVQFGASGREVLELAQAAGTLAYMAPEQRLGRFVDARADLFSLGCLLYECLCGVLPFGPSGLQEWSTQAALPASHHNPEVTPELDRLLWRLLAKDPKDRIGYADDVEGALAESQGVTAQQGPRSVYLYRPDYTSSERLLPRLEEALLSGLDEQAGVVLVTGQSGAGKTRLLLELAARAAEKRLTVITGECPPVSVGGDEVGALGAPLQPFRQFLVSLADACRSRSFASARPGFGERIAALAPYEPALAEIRDRFATQTPEELPVAAARTRLFTSLAGLFGDFARERPWVLLLDDLQWADELSLEFLSWLVEAPAVERAPYVVLGTCRTEGMGERLRALSVHPRVVREDLRSFDRAQIKRVVADMLALAEPPEALVDFVHDESGGNPFFVAEYLRAIIDSGLLRRDAAGRWRLAAVGTTSDLRERVLAPSSAAVLGLRLKGLDRIAVDVLQAAAVLGREFDAELVARTAAQDVQTVLSAYATLRPRHILEEDERGVSRFAHDKLRELAYGAMNAERRLELHGRAAQALEERYATRELTPHWGELGYHYARGGAPARAFEYYARAGARAQERFANRDALKFYRLAIEQLETDAPSPSTLAALSELHELAGDALVLLGNPAEAREMFEIALRRDADSSSLVTRVRRGRKLAQTWERQHRHVEALTAYAAAEQHLGDAELGDDPELCREYVQIQVDKAWDLYFTARVDELAALVESARPLVMRHALPVQKARFLQAVVQASAKRERFRITDETLEYSRLQLEAATGCSDLRELCVARFTRGFVLTMRGLDEAADDFYIAAIDGARRIDDAMLRARSEAYYSISHRRLGRLADARSASEALLAYTAERNMLDYVGVAHANFAWNAWRDGRLAEAEELGMQALAMWQRLRPGYVYPFEWLARMPLLACLHASSRLSEAVEQLRALLEDPQQLPPAELQRQIEDALVRGDATAIGVVLDTARRFRFL